MQLEANDPATAKGKSFFSKEEDFLDPQPGGEVKVE